MNKVFASKDSKRPLNNREILKRFIKIIKADGAIPHPIIVSMDPDEFVKERLQGALCACEGNGEFILIPMEECLLKNGGGGKYYMKCKKCGEHSHL